MRYLILCSMLSSAACSGVSEPRRQCIVSSSSPTSQLGGGYTATVITKTEVFPKLGESCAGLGGHYE